MLSGTNKPIELVKKFWTIFNEIFWISVSLVTKEKQSIIDLGNNRFRCIL